MKVLKLICTACLIALASLTNAQEAAPIDSSYINGHYTQRLDFFRKMPNRKGEIVFVGNSITEGGKWQELFPKKKVINRGISGDVTYGILARLDEVLESKPARIFLLSGVNDMKRGISNDVILQNFKRMMVMVKTQSPKTKLYMQSVLPVNEAMLPSIYAQVKNSKINDLNQKLEALCKEMNVSYINLHPALADEKGSLRKEWSIDGLHLRQASYVYWANELKRLKVI
ncbi:GDSL-type esterase/lipase family protein [Pedobacter sp. ASV28]|uniref:GDSL-type esterase/lipase family protein n=1 Tax=Pedobacter sp. ASV28 TaxID=2795123 RepID=UPI0018EBB1F1|nr:GDSL-type esterase/lipase family protein [Pedobacter sp. ASV28]